MKFNILNKKNKNIIKFTPIFDVYKDFYPKPASKKIPEWYKKTEGYINGEKKPLGDGNVSATIKRCMPVFDVMNAGYIIETYVDLYVSPNVGIVSQDENNNPIETTEISVYQYPSYSPIEFHSFDQAPYYPNAIKNRPYAKFLSPWGITTPNGYSTLFLNPVHSDSPIHILEGLVDTDKYIHPVNFPFILKDHKFEGLIPAGTPIVQVIPIKRESWEMCIGDENDIKELSSQKNNPARKKFFDSYKVLSRQPKDYR